MGERNPWKRSWTEGTLLVTPRRMRTRRELIPTGRASVAQRMIAKKTTAMTLCPWGDRPAKGGRRITKIKIKNAEAILKTWFTDSFLESRDIFS
jgi:hypothetical protein